MRALLMCLLLSQATTPGMTDLEVRGDFTEPLSQLSCPERVGAWSRSWVTRYVAPFGHSVTYTLTVPDERMRAKATVYVYPLEVAKEQTAEEHVVAHLRELAAGRPDMEVVSKGPDSREAEGRTIEGYMATFIFRKGAGEEVGPVVSHLRIARYNTYWLKWRISYPADTPRGVVDHLADLVAALVPPPRP